MESRVRRYVRGRLDRAIVWGREVGAHGECGVFDGWGQSDGPLLCESEEDDQVPGEEHVVD